MKIKIYCIDFSKHFISFVFLIVCIIVSSEPLCAENETDEERPTLIENSINKCIEKCGFKSFGLKTGIVVTDEFDVGFGVGAQLPREIFNPSIELISSMYFWGASKDSLDVSSIGLEESLTLKRSFTKWFSFFTGITLGYYVITEKTDTIVKNTMKTLVDDTYSFESYIISGTTFSLKSNRSVFIQIKYGLTQDSNELHVLLGLNIYK